ncbi:CHAP domain-containing protein [Yinghuangia seranimata]|uniref:CHAP domain-containing protein n=1 Tax=Yinghuangia seranimata TaxID=408067 RepID=UPI00248BEAE5|nr:CHAP domain-containing protein [Yinghuangia seranimata]MDI2131184.1 CHAP domain-containing protein [Yinghuangia seranimata]
MSPSAESVIGAARGEVGYHEGMSPSGHWNNIQKYSEEVPGLAWSNGEPWCATFVSWCAMTGDAADLFPRTASCGEGLDWFRRRGRGSDYPAVGAQVFYGVGGELGDGGHHTGVVYAYDATYIYTVEGNAQPLDAAVLTPRGYVRMGDIAVGDDVVDPAGMPSTVTGVFPKGTRKVYRVTLQDGSTTEACDEHLWGVEIDARKPRTVTTAELARVVASPNMRVRLPQIQPVEYLVDEPLPLPPYLLGALIGEGRMSGVGPHLTDLDAEASAALGGLGLWGKTAREVFIPEQYKRATVKDRLELLRGLMDTGGDIDAAGRIDFGSCCAPLAEDVGEVVRSLGGHTSLKTEANAACVPPACRLQNIDMPFHNPFAVPRKAERFRPRSGAWHRRVVSVEYLRDDEVQCIRVSAPSHLYVTDDFIPTHNTNQTGSAEGDGVYFKKRLRRDPYVFAYGYPAYPGGITSADPAWGGGPAAPPQVEQVSLARLQAAARADAPAPGTPMAYRAGTLLVERALVAEGLLDARYADGSYGTKTLAAYAAWQRRLGYAGGDADGIPGNDSLARLGAAHGFQVV